MVEITINNFEEKYPEIVKSLTNAVFIAVDTEFTGLLSDPELKSSLFDTGAERYDKLRQNIGHFIIMEAGITTFRFVQDKNKYEANKYTFYIFPRSFSSIDSKFTCQASCLEFLCQHNFDFNKFVYEGVPYLNRQQEECLRKELREGSLFRNLERTISHDDEKSIQLVCSCVAEWAASAVLEDTLHLDNFDICQGEKRLSYVVHKELRQRFPDIWTFQDSGRIQVKKIPEMQRKEYEENREKDKSMEEDMLDSLLGFSRLFKLLIELKKPIVGHNLLLDLMIMYNQFHEQLPTQFSDFKKKIHKLFPVIYDTKFLSYEMKKILKKEDLWDSNVLSNLYHYFKEGRGRHVVLYSPIIELKGEAGGHGICWSVSDPQEARLKMLGQSEDRDEKFHEAGWDSFCTGYCFIRMAHIYASLSFGRYVQK
ncbi:hypothetical protein Cfor_08890 [Coptotermes formosanus]|uniref:Uncharacterized protein n=1 Tax=Coptotermes formosanus TaxID=36987 RepID=A0A6L2PDU4_COPFO|nr:hypothetical protein Cfor_08890 [Coptotermes formosanus]